MPQFEAQHLLAVMPEIILTGAALLILLLESLLPEEGKGRLPGLAGLALAAAALSTGAAGRFGGEPVLLGAVYGDAYAAFLRAVLYAGGVLVVLSGRSYLSAFRVPAGEFLALFLLALTGAGLVVAAADLVTFYVAIELMSLSSYVLAGFLRQDPRSGEAALKYFLNGATSSAILLFGLSILYGLTGTTRFAALGPELADDHPALVATALAFLLAGLGFKFASVPFHLWVPDTYEGAPAPLAAFLSVGSEGAAVGGALRLLALGPAPFADRWAPWVVLLAAASMLWGNVTALHQRNVKRMLGYSSVAQIGYVLVGLAVAGERGRAAALFYLLAYTFTNLGAWALVMATSRQGETLDAFRGLARRDPFLALAGTVFFLSLIGLPFTAGFFGKLYLIGAAVAGGWTWLAVLVAVNSVISVGYYWTVVRNMYLREPEGEPAPLLADGWLRAAVAVSLVMALGAGVVPQFVTWAQLAAQLP